jgi:hypothetical protein
MAALSENQSKCNEMKWHARVPRNHNASRAAHARCARCAHAFACAAHAHITLHIVYRFVAGIALAAAHRASK